MLTTSSAVGRTVPLVFLAIVGLHHVSMAENTGPVPALPQARVPVPGAAALQEARNLVNEVYGPELAKAQTAKEKAAVGQKLLQAGIETRGDAAGRYVLLVLTADVATQAGDAKTAFAATDEVAAGYAVDSVNLKAELLAKLGKEKGVSPAILAERSDLLVDEAIAAERFDVARQMADEAVVAAKKNGGSIQAAIARAQEIAEIETGQVQAKKALATLATDPNDPSARLTIGRYYCLVKGDWEKGLPMLASSSDTALKALAQTELAKPIEAAKVVELADGWWDLAPKEQGVCPRRLREHATEWYRKALPELTGLLRAKVEKRLAGSGVGSSQERRRASRDSSDAAVQAAVDKAAAYLWRLQKPDGSWEAFGGTYSSAYMDGPTALIAYALMESGVSPSDDRMKKALTWLERISARNDKGLPIVKGYVSKTYCLGLRCLAWRSAIRQGAKECRRVLQRDAKQLILSTSNGSYAYDATGRPAAGDNSCSQYGLLGVSAAAIADLEVPRAYWLLVKKYWESTQCNDGGWVYNGKGAVGVPTMSSAGVASLLLCFDNLYGGAFASCSPGREGSNAVVPIQRGLEWFDKSFAATMGSGNRFSNYGSSGVDGYYLYGVARIGLASGYKFFGKTDWYQTGLKLLLTSQAADGSWAGTYTAPVSTAQCMLFLIHGRRPVIFNKLKYEGDWNNRPRDLAMLTRWMGNTVFAQEVSWRIVSLATPPAQWHDAPSLLITGSKAPTFGTDDLDKLRAYVDQGGTIFSVTECGGDGFEKGMRETYAKLFPEYELKEAPLTHDLYRIQEDLTRAKIKFHVISRGDRVLAIHVNKDLPQFWQTNQATAEKWAFGAALNVYLYVADRPPPRAP